MIFIGVFSLRSFVRLRLKIDFEFSSINSNYVWGFGSDILWSMMIYLLCDVIVTRGNEKQTITDNSRMITVFEDTNKE